MGSDPRGAEPGDDSGAGPVAPPRAAGLVSESMVLGDRSRASDSDSLESLIFCLGPALPLYFFPVAHRGILPAVGRELGRFGFRDRDPAQFGEFVGRQLALDQAAPGSFQLGMGVHQ